MLKTILLKSHVRYQNPRPISNAGPSNAASPPLTLKAGASGSSSSLSTDASRSRVVAALVVQKEHELADMLQPAPGKLAPKAAVVAALRKEIAALRQQLKNEVAAQLPLELAADLPSPPEATGVDIAAPTAAMASTSTLATATLPTATSPPTATTTTAAAAAVAAAKTAAQKTMPPSSARSALLLVEQQLSYAAASNGIGSTAGPSAQVRSALVAIEQQMAMGAAVASTTEQAELEALQQENSLLKERLAALEERQHRLEQIKERAGRNQSSSQTGESEEEPKKKVRRSKTTTKPKTDGDGSAEEKPRRAPRRSAKKASAGAGGDAPPTRRRRSKDDGAKESGTSAGLEKSSSESQVVSVNRRLHQARGDWDKPSTFRNWNDPSARHEATPPLAIESYREYKNYVLKESQPIALIAAGQEPLRIEGPPSISSNPSPNAATQKTTSQT